MNYQNSFQELVRKMSFTASFITQVMGVQHLQAADLGFPRGSQPRRGMLTYFLAKNLRKPHENQLNWI